MNTLQEWVMLNVTAGTPWNKDFFIKKLGLYIDVKIRRGNPKLLKAYYFPAAGMTLQVNVYKGLIDKWYREDQDVIENKGISASKTKQNPPAPVKKHLGNQDMGLGSHNQAKALLELIAESPDSNGYQISYKTEMDVVAFGCNLQKDDLVRIHQYPDGTGTVERWQGHVLYRLKAGAREQSINDTPSGKVFGVMQQF